jgi:hypothetical protein
MPCKADAQIGLIVRSQGLFVGGTEEVELEIMPKSDEVLYKSGS